MSPITRATSLQKNAFYLQEADLAAAPLTITSTRERVVDFSKPFMTLGTGMLMNRKDVFYRPDQAVRANPLFFLMPITIVAWILIVIAILVVRKKKISFSINPSCFPLTSDLFNLTSQSQPLLPERL